MQEPKTSPLVVKTDKSLEELELRDCFDWQTGAHPRKVMFAGDDVPMAWKMKRIYLKDKENKKKK